MKNKRFKGEKVVNYMKYEEPITPIRTNTKKYDLSFYEEEVVYDVSWTWKFVWQVFKYKWNSTPLPTKIVSVRRVYRFYGDDEIIAVMNRITLITKVNNVSLEEEISANPYIPTKDLNQWGSL